MTNEKQCSRCRKRKIKCSGDLGNGQGCLNCKNAGTDPNSCQFLRVCVPIKRASVQFVKLIMGQVSSYDAGCGMLSTAEYPYPILGLNATPSVNPGPLGGLKSFQVANSMSAVSTPAQMPRYSLGGSYSCAVGSPVEYYGYNGSEGSFEPYNFHSSSHANSIAPHDVMASTSMYTNPEPIRQWGTGLAQPGRAASSMYEDSPSAKSAHGLPHLPLTATVGEVTSRFSEMSALANSLPPSMLGDRVLPNPKSNLLSSPTPEAPVNSSQAYVPEGSTPIKSDLSWAERNESLPNSITASPNTSTFKSHLATHPEDLEGSFSYSHFRSPSTSQATESSSPHYAITATTTAASTLDEQIMSSTSYGTNSYTYSLPSTSKRPSATEGTLLSGQAYTPLPSRPSPAQQAHHQKILGLHKRERGDARKTSRASVTPVGGSYM